MMATCLFELSTEEELNACGELESEPVPVLPDGVKFEAVEIPAATEAASQSNSDYEAALADFHERLNEAKDELAEASIEFAEIDRAHKAAKKRCKRAVAEIEEISRDAPTPEGIDQRPQAVAPSQSLDHSTDEPLTANSPAGEASEAWKSVPISALQLVSIKGLGDKILAAISQKCPMIGDLEALRAEGTGKGRGLRSINRLGEEKAQAIEDRLIDWLTKNRDSHLFTSAARPSAQDTAEARAELGIDETDDIESHPAELEDRLEAAFKQADKKPSRAERPFITPDDPVAPGDPADPASKAAAVSLRITQLNTGEDDCLDCHAWTTAYEDGMADFWNGNDPVDIQYVIGSPQGDDWLRGWLKAQLEQMEAGDDDDQDAIEGEQTDDGEASESEEPESAAAG